MPLSETLLAEGQREQTVDAFVGVVRETVL